MNIEVKVLGPGCANCKPLCAEVDKAIQQFGARATLTKVEEIREIMAYKVLATPALVVNGVVKSTGRVPSSTEIVGFPSAESARRSNA